MPRDLHPSFGPGPAPLQICCGCSKPDSETTLVPVPHQTTVFICGICAWLAHVDVLREGTRRTCEMLMDAVSPEVAAGARQ